MMTFNRVIYLFLISNGVSSVIKELSKALGADVTPAILSLVADDLHDSSQSDGSPDQDAILRLFEFVNIAIETLDSYKPKSVESVSVDCLNGSSMEILSTLILRLIHSCAGSMPKSVEDRYEIVRNQLRSFREGKVELCDVAGKDVCLDKYVHEKSYIKPPYSRDCYQIVSHAKEKCCNMDDCPVLSIKVTESSIDSNSGQAQIIVFAREPVTSTVVVSLKFVGDVSPGVDFLINSSDIVIPSGSQSGNVTITGTASGENKAFHVILPDSDNYTRQLPISANLQIIDLS